MRKPFTPRRRRTALLIVLATALFFSAAAFRQKGGHLHKTDHYYVWSDISPAFSQLVGKHMETIYRLYRNRFESFGSVGSRKFNVAVYGTGAAYRKAVPAQVAGSTGAFVPWQHLLVAHADGRTHEEVLRTLYHEGFHQFMYRVVSKKCPPWVNEGLAEYFSEATWNGKGFTTGQVPTGRLLRIQAAISRGDYVPFRRLFALSGDEWIQNVSTNQRRAIVLYNQSWAIVHFLLKAENSKHASLLNYYLKQVDKGKHSEEAFSEAIGVAFGDLESFEKAWAQYVMSLSPSSKFRCRDNMQALLLLASEIYEGPRGLKNIHALRRELLRGGRHGFEVALPSGARFTSAQKAEVAKLFRCPFDQRRHDISYVKITHTPSQLPLLVCTHHPGIIIKAYYKRTANGGFSVEVEEQVAETVSADFRQAVIEAGRN